MLNALRKLLKLHVVTLRELFTKFKIKFLSRKK